VSDVLEINNGSLLLELHAKKVLGLGMIDPKNVKGQTKREPGKGGEKKALLIFPLVLVYSSR
jgi:hypothetical protein